MSPRYAFTTPKLETTSNPVIETQEPSLAHYAVDLFLAAADEQEAAQVAAVRFERDGFETLDLARLASRIVLQHLVEATRKRLPFRPVISVPQPLRSPHPPSCASLHLNMTKRAVPCIGTAHQRHRMYRIVFTPQPPLHRSRIEAGRGNIGDGEGENDAKCSRASYAPILLFRSPSIARRSHHEMGKVL